MLAPFYNTLELTAFSFVYLTAIVSGIRHSAKTFMKAKHARKIEVVLPNGERKTFKKQYLGPENQALDPIAILQMRTARDPRSVVRCSVV